jgi:hypothetical protein
MTISQRGALLELARERRRIALNELLTAACRSVVDPVSVSDLAREAGFEVVQQEGEPWEDLERLAEQGQTAFRVERKEVPVRKKSLDQGVPRRSTCARSVAHSCSAPKRKSVWQSRLRLVATHASGLS